jgi:hypothetical protein
LLGEKDGHSEALSKLNIFGGFDSVSSMFCSVFRIHDILVWILIRILDPYPAAFVIDLQDANKKLIFYKVFLLIEVHLHHFSKIKSEKSHKTVEIKVFHTIFV